MVGSAALCRGCRRTMPSPASLALGVYSTRKWFSARSLHTSLTSDSVSTSVPSRSKMTSSTGCCCCCAPASGATAMPSGGGHPLAVCAVRPRGACGTPWYVRVLLCSPGCKRKAPDLWKRRRSDEKLEAPSPGGPCSEAPAAVCGAPQHERQRPRASRASRRQGPCLHCCPVPALLPRAHPQRPTPQ